MKSVLSFDFTVKKEENKIYVSKEFEADLNLVWDAWTKAELLDQWWGPLPYKVHTLSMKFEKGGTWLYAMSGPQGDTHYCKSNYHQIEAQKSIRFSGGFCDDQGNDISEMPGHDWLCTFTQEGDVTTVNIILSYESEAELEAVISMGFKEGLTLCIEQLDQLLSKSQS